MRILIYALMVLGSTNTFAYTLLHDEPTHGDMSFSSFPIFGELSSGQYALNGAINWVGCPESYGSPYCIGDLDAFTFSTPINNLVNVSIESNISLTMQPETLNSFTNLELNWSLTNAELFWGIEAINNPVSKNIFNLHGYAGQNYFFQTPTWSLSYTGPDLVEGEIINMEYSILLDVHPVPLPGGIIMFFSGLLFLSGIKKKLL